MFIRTASTTINLFVASIGSSVFFHTSDTKNIMIKISVWITWSYVISYIQYTHIREKQLFNSRSNDLYPLSYGGSRIQMQYAHSERRISRDKIKIDDKIVIRINLSISV